VVFTLIARRLGYRLGGDVVVRCRQGHLFTTLWIPGVKLKAVDLVVAAGSVARLVGTGAWSSRSETAT
jgi:hypothetical protein